MGSTLSIKSFYLFLLLVLHAASTQAEILILVHGFNSNASTWNQSGISAALYASGWRHNTDVHQSTNNVFYTVNLPSQAPLLSQAELLNSTLLQIQNENPGEALILAGHSAGGVVSRLALLSNTPNNVSTLITIASPHLGTYRASQALDIVDSRPFFCPGPGFDFMKSLFGGNSYRTLKHSRSALIDLLPPSSNNLLHWANLQPHPDINYHSVIRYNPNQQIDSIVPSFSQDMNQVPALAGKSTLWPTPASHALSPNDGFLIASILKQAH
jgi:triacylglycerol lipase